MRLLFVMNSARHFVLNRLWLARASAEAGHDVAVAAYPDDPKSVQTIEATGISCHLFPIQRRGYPLLRSAITLYYLWRIFTKVQPDIIISYTIKTVILSGLLCRVLGTPFVALITGRGTAFNRLIPRTIATFLYRRALAGPHVTVCFQNLSDKQFFLDHRLCVEEQTQIVGNGISLEQFPFHPLRERSSSRTILMAARLLREKGVREYLAAAEIIRREEPSARFVLAGAPDPGNPSSLHADELRILCNESGVEWMGHSHNIASTLRDCDILCLPTYYGEGLPVILLQAGAMGRALIATDVPGCQEVVHNEQTGLLIPPRSITALVGSIRRYLRDPAFMRKCGSRVRERVTTRFSHDVHLRQFSKVFASIGTKESPSQT